MALLAAKQPTKTELLATLERFNSFGTLVRKQYDTRQIWRKYGNMGASLTFQGSTLAIQYYDATTGSVDYKSDFYAKLTPAKCVIVAAWLESNYWSM